MSRPSFNQSVLSDISWWHWALTIPLLAAHLAGIAGAMATTMALCGSVGVYFWTRIRQLRPMPVQVRIAYFGLLAAGLLPWMQWIHWIQLAGTSAMVIAGYCPLIRILSLLPLNRSEPISRALVWKVFVQVPLAGGLIRWNSSSTFSTNGPCSLSNQMAGFDCSMKRVELIAQEVVQAHPLTDPFNFPRFAPLAVLHREEGRVTFKIY